VSRFGGEIWAISAVTARLFRAAGPRGCSARLFRARSRRTVTLLLRRCVFAVASAMFASCTSPVAKQPGENVALGLVCASDRPKVSHQFAVLNTTRMPVRLLAERHSCSCTEVVFTPCTLQPGESTSLKLTVTIPEKHSEQQVSCIVRTDHVDWPEWAYTINFTSYPRLVVEPDIIRLGSHRMTGSNIRGEAQFDIYRETPRDGSGEAPSAGSPHFLCPPGISVRCPERPQRLNLAGGLQRERYKLAIDLRREKQSPGYRTEALVAVLPDGAEARAWIVWELTGPLSARPAEIHFGLVEPGAEPRRAMVVIRSEDERPFRVVGIESSSPFVRVEFNDDGGSRRSTGSNRSVSLACSIPSDYGARYLAGRIAIRTDARDIAELVVPWSAFVRRAQVQTPLGRSD
jgi:hypothetical protein